MKTYKEMADDALNRISQYETEKQNKRKRTIRIATSVVSCCLVAAGKFDEIEKLVKEAVEAVK